MPQPITLCIVTDACKEFGNSIYQTLVSRFILRNRTLSGRRVQHSSIILVYHSYGPARFSSSLARTPCRTTCRTSFPALQHFVASSSFLGTLPASSGKKFLLDLLRINIARINTREVIKSVSSLSYFSKLCGFVIWIFSVSGLNSWF